MVTKRKRSSEPNKANAAPIQPDGAPRAENTPVDQPERPIAPVPTSTSTPTPRKRADAPAKAVRPVPSKKAVQAVAPEPTAAPIVKPVFVTPSESVAEDASPTKRPSRFKRATRPVGAPEVDVPVPEDAKSGEDAQKISASKRRTVKQRKRRWPLVVAGVILLIVLAVVAAFSWDRWLRYDDAAELQGEWQTHGSTAVVVIDGQQIKLTEDVAYSYTLDTGAKTLSYTFGNWTGEGRYRFSLDRSQLVIFDDDNATWFSTLTDDLGWMFDQAIRSLQGQAPEEMKVDETTTVFDRLSHDAAATPREGTAVATEEPQPPSADASEGSAEAGDTAGTTNQPETDTEQEAGDSDNSQGDADPGTPATPGGLFDVSDVAA